MTAFSTYLEDKVIDIVLRGDNTWVPPTVYLALFTDSADTVQLEASDFTNEITNTDPSYVRKPVTFSPPVDGVTSNAGDVSWSPATVVWGTVQYVAVVDALPHGTGKILFYGVLSTPKLIAINDTFSFALGDMAITID